MKKTFFTRIVAVLAALAIAIIPLSASAQYYYDQQYYPSYNYNYDYNYGSGYNDYYRGYNAPVYNYSYTYPNYQSSYYNDRYNNNYNNSYSYGYGYPAYTYPQNNYNYGYNQNYGYNYNYGYSRSANQELENVTDLDGNVIGDYDRTGTSYNPYYSGYSASSSTTSNYYYGRDTYTIEIDDNHYVPMSVTVKRGTTIKWINKDGRNHTVTGDRSSYNIESNTLKRNESYSKTFNSTGTYRYHDRYNSSLKGKIVVIN